LTLRVYFANGGLLSSFLQQSAVILLREKQKSPDSFESGFFFPRMRKARNR
jgi:hypothetical protein